MDTLNILNEKQSLVNVKVGKGVKFFNFVNAYGCFVDDFTKVGAFVEIQKGATIYVTTNFDDEMHFVESQFTLIQKNDTYAIFDLTKPLTLEK